MKSENSQRVTSLWTKDGGEKPSISTSHGPVSALSTGQAVFNLITTLQRVAASISQTEGGSQREQRCFTSLPAAWRGYGQGRLQSFSLSAHIVMKANQGSGCCWALNTWHLKQLTAAESRNQKTGKMVPPPANEIETGWRQTSVLQKALETVNSNWRERVAHTSQNN